jgi:hypothetical protein
VPFAGALPRDLADDSLGAVALGRLADEADCRASNTSSSSARAGSRATRQSWRGTPHRSL